MTPTIVEALQTIQKAESFHSQGEPTQLPSEQQTGKDIEGSILKTSTDNEAQLNREDSERDAKLSEGKCQSELPVQHNVHTANLDEAKLVGNAKVSQEPPLADPKIGNPISHSQIIDLWGDLKKHNLSPLTLEFLLRGSRVYVPPPTPKAEPVSCNLTIHRCRIIVRNGSMKIFITSVTNGTCSLLADT